MILPLLASLLGIARAEEPVWALGRQVSQVSLEAPEGGLPRETLEPLLQVHQGERLDLADVRQDVTILYRVGGFASVEAAVEPWFDLGPDGAPLDAVRVIYRVIPAPRIGDVVYEGVRGPARALVIRAADLNRGQAFFPAEQAGEVVTRVTAALAGAGWPEATARYAQARDDEGNLIIRLRVSPGAAHRYGEIRLAGDPVLPERRLRRWLRADGVAKGRRVDEDALVEARKNTRDRLHAEGWPDAVLNVLRVPTDETGQTEDLRVILDAGLRVRLHARGRGLPATSELTDILGFIEGQPPGEESVPDLEERLTAWYQARGWFEAQTHIHREVTDTEVHYDLEVRRGRRHVLGRITVQGASAFSAAYVAGALKEAAPDTLGKGIVTRDSVNQGLATVRDFYRSQGFLDARLSLVSIDPGRPGPSGVPLDLAINVTEGPRTWLSALDTQGGVGGGGQVLEARALADAQARLVDQPFNPSSLDTLAQQITEIYQAHGYLNADVRSASAVKLLDPTRAEAVALLTITPGEQVRLRSVAIQGNRRTRRDVIARELRVGLGDPITPDQLEATRSALYALDLFDAVTLNLLGDDDRSRDLVVEVDEKPNVQIELGGGLSTDEGIAARLRATHRNLGGLGQRVSFLGQVGYGWLGDRWILDSGSPVWRAALHYEAPNVPARGYRLTSEILLNEAVQEPYWRLSRSGASVGLSARWGDHVEAFLDYHYQWRQLEDADPGALVQGEPWWPAGSAEAAPDTPTGWRRQGGTGLTVVLDGRDSPLNPTKGTLFTSAWEFADPLSADPAFVKGTALAEQLVPLGPLRLDLKVSGGLGLVAGHHTTLAVEDRFTLGGSGSLRGFKQDTVGPANLGSRPEIGYPSALEPVIDGTALRADSSQWVNTGGDEMVAITGELSAPLSALGLDVDGARLVLFSDLGHIGFWDPAILTTSGQEALDDPSKDPFWRLSVGAGVHIATPIGPAALDVGFNLNRISERDEPLVVPHLSLGAL